MFTAMVCAASEHLNQLRIPRPGLACSGGARVRCDKGKEVFLWLERLLGEQGGCTVLRDIGP